MDMRAAAQLAGRVARCGLGERRRRCGAVRCGMRRTAAAAAAACAVAWTAGQWHTREQREVRVRSTAHCSAALRPAARLHRAHSAAAAAAVRVSCRSPLSVPRSSCCNSPRSGPGVLRTWRGGVTAARSRRGALAAATPRRCCSALRLCSAMLRAAHTPDDPAIASSPLDLESAPPPRTHTHTDDASDAAAIGWRAWRAVAAETRRCWRRSAQQRRWRVGLLLLAAALAAAVMLRAYLWIQPAAMDAQRPWTEMEGGANEADGRRTLALAPAVVSEASAVVLYRALGASAAALSWWSISEAADVAAARSSVQGSNGASPPSAAPSPAVRVSPPGLRLVSPRHCVLILVSWSASQCAQARVTWRSVRRLDPNRHKDVLFAIQFQKDDATDDTYDDTDDQDQQLDDADRTRQRRSGDTRQERMESDALFRAFRRSRGGARIPQCESLVQIIRYESQLQQQSLQRLHELRMQLSGSSVSSSSASSSWHLDASHLPALSAIGLGRTAFAFFDAVAIPPKAHIRYAAWYFALHKLQLFAVGMEPTDTDTANQAHTQEHTKPHRFTRLVDGVLREDSFPPVWRGRYERALLLDSDIVLVHSLDRYFPSSPALGTPLLAVRGLDSSSDLAGVHEQSAHCSRDKLNGGLLSFRPSRSLHAAALRTLSLSPGGSCEQSGKELQEAEQSVLNCMCGFSGGPAIRRDGEETAAEVAAFNAGAAPRDQFALTLRAHDIRCELLPSSASLFSGSGDVDSHSTTPPCSLPPAEDVSALHFTWKPKPHEWGMQEEWRECRAHSRKRTQALGQPSGQQEAKRADTDAASGDVPDPPRPDRCYRGTAAMFTFWHCIAGASDVDHAFDPTQLQAHCAYTPLDTATG